ncbi:MAG TPA: alpha/beta fold hydrolase [Jatrophihabitans sp.]|nr:alpha/beta fold hydrolase [Jatrophihabitans sp.]
MTGTVAGRIPLFLLPPAAGSAVSFDGWPDSPELAAQPLELPGRRFGDPAPLELDLAAAVDWLDLHRPAGGADWALLGHSMGGLLAAAWAERATAAGHPPRLLVLSSVTPPWPRSQAVELLAAGPDELWDRMIRLGGIPDELSGSRTFRRLIEPRLLADVRLAASWQPAGPPRLDCPILSCSGADDAFVPPAAMLGWAACTGPGRFRHRVLPGGHFYRSGLVDLHPLLTDPEPAAGRPGPR